MYRKLKLSGQLDTCNEKYSKEILKFLTRKMRIGTPIAAKRVLLLVNVFSVEKNEHPEVTDTIDYLSQEADPSMTFGRRLYPDRYFLSASSKEKEIFFNTKICCGVGVHHKCPDGESCIDAKTVLSTSISRDCGENMTSFL